MSESGASDAPDTEGVDVKSPEEIVNQGLEDALAMLNEAEDVGPVEEAKAEREASAELARAVAQATLRGLPDSAVSQMAGVLSDEAKHLNKQDVKGDIEGAVEDATRGGEGEATSLNELIEDHLISVEAVRSSDAKQSTLYRWTFDGGNETGDSYSIETGFDAPTNHFSILQLQRAIFDVSGVWTTAPSKGIVDQWDHYIAGVIERRGDITWTKGSRTLATEALTNHIVRSVGYPSVEPMFENHGVRVDDDPVDGEPTEVWVRAAEVSRICEEHGITPRALQVELDAKDYLVDRIRGASESTHVGSEHVTYWVVSTDLAMPETYEPNPESASERVARIMAEDEAAEGNARADGDAPDTDEASSSVPERVGKSFGPPPGGEDDDPVVEDEDDDGGEDDK